LEALTLPAASILEALLDDGSVWLLVGMAPGQTVPPVLAARLDVVTLRVPPLARRADELPAIAAQVAAALSARRGGSPPAFSGEARAGLAARPWPGDLAELGAVGAGALLRAAHGPITARHLRGEETTTADPGRAASDGARIEYLAAEMAHELKNSLVTIKTFADHLPALVDDAELRTRFAGLASESITRMDELLENVLAFARLGTPRPAPIEIGPLVDAVVAEIESEVAGRGVRVEVEYAGANGTRHHTDADQLTYALRNLLAGVLREVSPGEALRVDGSVPGLVRLRFSARNGAAGRLRRLVVADDALDPHDPTLLPLPFTLARTVLERNGGALVVRADGDGLTTLEVHLPGGEPNGG